MASPRARVVLLAAGAPFALAACTLLARFDDLPLADAGLDAPASLEATPPPDGGPPKADAGADARARDADAAPDVDPCLGHPNGSYCGGDGLGAPASDLLRCDGGAVAVVIACDAGCLALSNPFPDTCNGCGAKPNGDYCGRDFPEFPPADSDWLIQCQLGNAVQKVACAHGCTSNGGASTCAP